MDVIEYSLEQALADMLVNPEGRVDLKTLPPAFFDYFEVSEAEKAA